MIVDYVCNTVSHQYFKFEFNNSYEVVILLLTVPEQLHRNDLRVGRQRPL